MYQHVCSTSASTREVDTLPRQAMTGGKVNGVTDLCTIGLSLIQNPNTKNVPLSKFNIPTDLV